MSDDLQARKSFDVSAGKSWAPIAIVTCVALIVVLVAASAIWPRVSGGKVLWSRLSQGGSSSNRSSGTAGPTPSLERGGELTEFNVALDENGGAIESISGTVDPANQFYGPGYNGRRLIDGKTDPVWNGDNERPPDTPPLNPVPGIPLAIVLSFYQHQSALVGAVAITPGEDLAKAPKDVEVWISNTSPSDGFQKVGGGTLPPDAAEHQISFPPVEARYLKVRVLSNQQDGVDGPTNKPTLEIAEIRVLEARRAGYVSIRDRNPDLPRWKGSPRYAAQHGVEWLQPASVAWQQWNTCYGCHIQSQVVMGLAVAKKGGYIVDDQAVTSLANFTETQQKPDGSYDRQDEGSTAFAGMGMTYWDDWKGIKRDPALLKAADYLLTRQDPSGQMPWGRDDEDALAHGLLVHTANTLTAFSRAYDQSNDSRYKKAADRALAWIAAAPAETTQDKVFKILALARFGGAAYKPAVQQLVQQLMAEQTMGGWRENTTDFKLPNPFSTGQVLYAFKQAGVSVNSSSFMKGVKYLVDGQEIDGSWKVDQTVMHTHGARYPPTMWAIIGLAGAFGDVKTGSLRVETQTNTSSAAAHNLEIILDCSGSMRQPLGTSTRIGTAREVLRQVLAKLPDDLNVGLRLYAHRYPWKDMQHSCTDTELVVPIEKLDRQRILTTVDKVQPRGDTPLVYSVLQTPADLKGVGGGSVIVITDGMETCHGDPMKAAAELKAGGIPVTLNIVGFTLKGKEKQDVEQLMRPFAEATGGHYYYAENGEALAAAVASAAFSKVTYEVFDVSGKQVAAGEVGPISQDLPPGNYRVVVHVGEQQLSANVDLKAGDNTILTVARKGQQFALEQSQDQPEQPVKQAAGGQGAP